MNKKRLKGLALGGLTCISLIGLIIAQAYMVFESMQNIGKNQSDKLPGEIGLRSYFDSGTGSATDPFVITRPMHFYNLSRLQVLGAFTGKTYFSLGKQINGTGDYYFYSSDADNSSNPTATYLDMQSYATNGTQIFSIGSTSSPFFGEFEGHGKTIANLTVDSDPEDIGVFGYVASGAKVSNTIFSNLTITDKGYPSSYVSTFYSDTYLNSVKSQNLLGIIYDANNVEGSTSSQTSSENLSVTALPSNTTSGTSSWTQVTEGSSDINKYLFCLDTAAIPDSYAGVEYNIRSSNSDLFLARTYNGKPCLYINRSLLEEAGNSSFNTVSNTAVYGRFYVTASILKNNVRYAKIIDTYTIYIVNNIVNEASVLSFNISRDPDLNADGTSSYSYKHNTNIGFIAGHCDGTLESDFVYCGDFKLNNSSSTEYGKMAAESELGLVGEVGVNINSEISPTKDYDSSGNTGIINFSNIYQNIRGTSYTGTATTVGGSTFYPFTPAATNLYDEYLRKRQVTNADSTTSNQCITDLPSSIDFKGQQIIKEDSTKSRGLGIFDLVTANYDNSDLITNYAQGLGECGITYDTTRAGTDKNDFNSHIYYETFELDATVNPTTGAATTPTEFFTSYGKKVTDWKSSATDKLRIVPGTTIPTTSGNSIFDSSSVSSLLSSKAFERTFNYIFKVPLSSNASGYYFSNTSNKFLKDYFSFKLRDKEGNKIKPEDSTFGVMVKEKSGSKYVNTTSFNSFFTMSSNTASSINVMSIDGVSYPTKTIEFNVSNENGANITIVAGSLIVNNTTNKKQSSITVSIYDKQYLTTSNTAYYPSYTMFVPGPTTSDDVPSSFGIPYYFNYDNDTRNVTSTTAVTTAHGATAERLYAHTFFVPKGNYFIGVPSTNASQAAYIYYIAAQGQNGKGDLGQLTTVYFNSDYIKDLDFLLYDPTAAGFSDKTDYERRAYLTFMSKFNSSASQFTVSINTIESLPYLSIVTDANCTDYLVESQKVKSVYVNGTRYDSTRFIKP